VVHLAFSADGQLLLMLTKHRHAYIFRVSDMTLLPALPQFPLVAFNFVAYTLYGTNMAVSWAPDNQHILLVFNAKPLMHRLGAADWDNVIPFVEWQNRFGVHMVSLCAWSPRADHTYALVSVGIVSDIWVSIYQNQKKHVALTIHIPTWDQESNAVSGLAYSSDGSLLALSTNTEPFIRFFSCATGTLLFNYTPPPFFAQKALAKHHIPWPHIFIDDDNYLHVIMHQTCYTHLLVPQWKRTVLLLLLLKMSGRGRGRGPPGRSLPHELWHFIACDFRDALQVSVAVAVAASKSSPIAIYK
jgi:hypothetical protein